MSYKFEESKTLIINTLVEKIINKLPDPQSQLCAEFVRQLYETVAFEDLSACNIDNLYGAAVNFWALLQHRNIRENKIHIYNPDFERHGWQTTHSVVEIITEDMPFIVDSLRMVLNNMGITCYLVAQAGGLSIKRGDHGQLIDIAPSNIPPHGSSEYTHESPVFMEIDRQTDPLILQELHNKFSTILDDNRIIVEDWPAMRIKVRAIIDELDSTAAFLDAEELKETKSFLHWLEDHHFTFLGIHDYELVQKDNATILRALPKTGLGILRTNSERDNERTIFSNIAVLPDEAKELILSPRLLVMSKTNTMATVHRQTYTDYIGIKRYNQQGVVIGECRIIGLYTSAAYNTSPRYIPFLRHKVALVMKNSNLNARSHAGKILLNILETLPRDDLIQAPEGELLDIAMGIYYMQDRPQIRLFARADIYHRFISCFVYVPKDRYNTTLGHAMQKILAESFNATEITFTTWFPTSSVLARIHFIIRINQHNAAQWDYDVIEKKLIDIGRSWTDDFKTILFESIGEERGNELLNRYKHAFPGAYCDNFSPRIAVYDISHIESLSDDNSLSMNFYRPMDEASTIFRLKIYRHKTSIPLSDVLPIIEHLGMRAISERPYKIQAADGSDSWISDFTLEYIGEKYFDIDEIKELFQNAFANIWFNEAENDGFNQLVLAAGLNWREVSILRAYAKYFKQIHFTFSQEYIEAALSNNPHIAKKIVALFLKRFSLDQDDLQSQKCEQLIEEIATSLDAVANLDEDKILRQYVKTIIATVRTNYYQLDNIDHNHKKYLSFKLDSHQVPGIPKPSPKFEIFVYSPRFEGVHLRCDKVARGGIRWSKRKEDFRTEILGLMKAQQVKNAIIVPNGAKGGFLPKQLPATGSREAVIDEGVQCYQLFIRGLLDITDNYNLDQIVKPKNVVCYDDDDPYLVVAPDTGTATFSDIANAISLEYGFWLGDAFASGGSVGYDHKKIGITARGAWESVKRHFYELHYNINIHDFSVIGIGDMSGDVFGNGMLMSKHIQLLGAFNHLHIFIDPSPDPILSYTERERLFHLPRSSWIDYDSTLISKGGGVFARDAKSIAVSPEMQQTFGIQQEHIEPNELIRIMLQASVELLWSAGIGTFVKAQTENHAAVGDKTNDAIRIDANELRCKIVAEGGNLGLTQLARIDYELNGGLIFTDFIDNSGGVQCSDKEVNIKIFLNLIMANGDLTLKQRNELLSEMTDEIADSILFNNFLQTRSISYIMTQTSRSFDLYCRYINELEQTGKIDRNLEFLPSEKTLIERKLMNKGLTRPEVAVLVCYGKIILKEQILSTNVPEDHFLETYLINYFPIPLQKRFAKRMQDHPLKREIIATKLSNVIIDEIGSAVLYRIQYETGAPIDSIVRAHIIVRTILNLVVIWRKYDIESIITAAQKHEIILLYVRLLRRLTRWFLRNQRMRLNISAAVKIYHPGVAAIKQALPEILGTEQRSHYDKSYDQYLALGLDAELSHEITVTKFLYSVTDIIDISQKLNIDVTKTAELYFVIGEYLELTWIRAKIIAHITENTWESLAREALRDDLDWQQRHLTEGIIRLNGNGDSLLVVFDEWSKNHIGLVERWRKILTDLRSSTNLNYTMFFVAIRELLDLTQTTVQMTEAQCPV